MGDQLFTTVSALPARSARDRALLSPATGRASLRRSNVDQDGPESLPSLFCFLVFRITGYELPIVREQFELGVGIFSCDEYIVISDVQIQLGPNFATTTIGDIHSGVAEWGSWSNTEVFMRAWSKIISTTTWRDHSWIVKGDVDAAIFPDRLRLHLQAAPENRSLYIQNWQQHPKMFGPIEVFSRDAVQTFFEGKELCLEKLGSVHTGEDGFMQACMELLEVGHVEDFSMLRHPADPRDCSDTQVVAFHPFKDKERYLQCVEAANTARLPDFALEAIPILHAFTAFCLFLAFLISPWCRKRCSSMIFCRLCCRMHERVSND